MTILDQIRDNDPSLVELHLDDVPEMYFKNVYDMIEAISENTFIEKVRFDEDFIGCMRADEKSKLVRSIGKLKSLKEIYLGNTSVLVMDLTEMVSIARGLVSLSLNGVLLQGLQYEFNYFEKAMVQHKKLKGLHMTEVIIADEGIKIDNIVKILKTNTSLDVSLDDLELSVNGAIAA